MSVNLRKFSTSSTYLFVVVLSSQRIHVDSFDLLSFAVTN